MYNPELKMKFIAQYTDKQSMARQFLNIFEMFETYEKDYGDDLCTMPLAKIEGILNESKSIRYRARYIRFSMVNQYLKWCYEVEKVKYARSELLNLNCDTSDAILEHMIPNPEFLQKYLDKIYTPESELTYDNVHRCYYWLAYSGITEQDISEIKKSDVDLDNMVIHYKGIDYPIYEQALPCIKNCVNQTFFVFYSPTYHHSIQRNRAPGDYILRGFKSSRVSSSLKDNISAISKEHQSETGVRLSHFRIWLSGVFYGYYLQEKQSGKVDFKAAAERFIKQKSVKSDLSLDNKSKNNMRYVSTSLKGDYERWKNAFNL